MSNKKSEDGNLKRLICVTNKEMADKLVASGHRSMTQHINDRTVFTFLENESLFELVNDKKLFSKKHWYIDKRLRF